MSWPLRIATLNKGGWPAGMTHDIDFVRQRYRYARRSYAAVTDIPGTTFTRSTAAYGEDTAGDLIQFASGVPRITNKGVLIEESRTNLLLQSQTFDNAIWTKGSATINADVAVAPDGASTADKLVENASTAQHLVLQSISVGASTYTYSVFVKAAERSWVFLQQDGIPTGQYFNVSTGSLGSATGTPSAASIVPYGNGWYRCIMTFTASAGTPAAYIMLASGNNASDYTGDGTSGLYLWGAQLEAGSSATSYIPTTSTSATRNTDVLASANDPNPTAYTVVAEFTIPVTGPDYGHIWGYDDGTANNRAFVYYHRPFGKLWLEVLVGGVSVASMDLGTATPGQSYKVAARIAANDFAAIKTGGTLATDASGAVPATSSFRHGGSVAGSEFFGGVVKRIRRWSVGKTNSELQALVA